MRFERIATTLCMTLSMTCLAESFHLKSEKSGKSYGPYEFEDGATVVIGNNSFTLVKSEPAPSALEKRMDEIVIPRLQLREASIASVLDFFRQASIDLDQREIPRDQKGVNFFLRGNPKEMPSITIDLRDVSLSEALKQVAEMADLTYSFDGDVAVRLEANK